MKKNRSTTAAKRKREESPDMRFCCAICQDVLLDPLAMPCGHVFDTQCLRLLLATDAPSMSRCPTCRAALPSPLPPVCTTMRDMVEELRPAAVLARRAGAAKERATLAFHTAVFPELDSHLPPEHALCQYVKQAMEKEQSMESLRSLTVATLKEDIRVLKQKLHTARGEQHLEGMRALALDRVKALGNAHKVRMMAVRLSIRDGADVNLMGVCGRTPLLRAASQGDKTLAHVLVGSGADLNKGRATDGATPLYLAAQNGHVEVARMLVDEGVRVNQGCTDDGATPIYAAAQDGHVEVARVLIEAGADVNQCCTDDGTTPLCIASQQGHVEVARVLLAAGARLNQLARADGCSPLFCAAQRGHADMVSMLLEAGADMNQACTEDGITPLCAAAQDGHVEVVCLLLDAGADSRKARADGNTPLAIATAEGYSELAQLLGSV
mmetsp:Transcript_41259/g.78847  ORF Transcript_41259/g.78847 Transcript_41259/m.78847 type:complete len:439 (+) Transcript_41259:89-1405(+)